MADQEEMNRRGSTDANTGVRRMTKPPAFTARGTPVPRRRFQCGVLVALFAVASVATAAGSDAVSFDTGRTITKVRTASLAGGTMIVGSSYEGEVLALSADGKPLWRNPLSGFMNHDLWCEDISGDDVDEILTANADGHVYCLDAAGELIWQFRPNEVPMYTLKKTSNSPVFLNGRHVSKAEDWDRSAMENDRYREKRDQRKNYALSHQEAVAALLSRHEDHPGTAFWGGHGNDPYLFSLDTLKKVIDGAGGKKTVLIYPELEDHSEDFAYVMENHFYPLAEYAQGKNANIFVRTKHCFWQGNIYLPMWQRALSGEFADVFVPAMEETSDKSMELSLAGRLGIWTSGSTENWGTRCARDNPSFDRSRQHSHQMLPNHFLRTMVYHLSCGARYVNNFPVDQQYMSLLWEMIAKGTLYVPRREEIVSFSPVHLSMLQPDHDYMLEGSNVKWCTFFDAQRESERPMVFSRLNGSWPGAPVTDWDFSRYAAGVRDRRLNFLPPYENGLVLITPPQSGALADKNAPRGALSDHMHPIYKNTLKEHYTDGRHYISADGKQKLPADQHYRQVESDIKEGTRFLPLTVSGDVAWVAAQTSPTHLRLTIIDGGYINPKTRNAIVSFQKAQPRRMVDILFGTEFDVSDPSSVSVTVPCGMFRFIDVELEQPLTGS